MGYSISKSRYCNGIQCPKMLWLRQNKPDAFDASCMNQSVLDTGLAVGDLAMGLFGTFVEVPYGDLNEMIKTTERLMAENTPVIAEASFSVDGLFCSVDILKRIDKKTVALYEVKSATAVHNIYYQDAAFQSYILRRLGYTVASCNIVHINNQYIRGKELDIHGLFTVVDITGEALRLEQDVATNIAGIRQYMQQTDEPEDDIGEHCFSPYPCGFFGYCTRNLPKPNVFDLAGARTSTKFKCYRKGIVSFQDLDTCDGLSAPQYMQIDHELFNYPPHIDQKRIKGFPETITYPLYFLDFESFQPAIPLYRNSRPFEQIVFQYSLHYIEQEGGELKHKAFLAYPGEDPRRKLAEQLCADIPLNACTTAYNMAFEKTRIRGLAELFPDLGEHLMNIHDHIVDLMVPFQKKWYYCKAMEGSYSIKYVLPALFPDDPALDYHNLEGIHNGGEASDAFARMAAMSEEEMLTTRAQLLSYCGLDTFAMVKVWEKLKEVSG